MLALAGQGTRLSAALADHPDHSLFPLPLSAQNVIAPEASSFLPGDLVGITVVIAARPQVQATPGLLAGLAFLSLTPEVAATPTPQAQLEQKAVERGFPPLAKDLFPQGVRVIAVQGLPVGTVQDASTGSAFTSAAAAPAVIDLAQERILILLVPDEAREALALALEQGNRLIVSLLSAGEPGASTGFTYWDFEERFRADREQRLAATITPPTSTPTRGVFPTALPTGSTGTPER